MTTAAEIRALIAPVLKRNHDLVLVKRHLIIKPVRHVIRSVYIDRRSWKTGLHPIWAASFLARPDAGIGLGFGSDWYPGIGHHFSIDQPDIAERLASAIEEFALPVLQPVVSISDFRAFADDTSFTNKRVMLEFGLYRLCVDIALGDLDQAGLICEHLLPREAKLRAAGYGNEIDEVLLLHPLVVAKNRKALAALLHQWEAAAVKRLKLEAYWEPSPFPIEEMG